MKKHFRIVVVDDNELIRHGLCRMLESEKDMRVVGDFASADDAIQQVGTLSPDVVLMDVEMPGKNGIEATHHLKNNGLNCQAEVIILAECADYLIGALAAGAAGYIYKNVNGGELAQV
ncbi:MAG: response regulator transcription factor, partial [Chloroflexi bacterium]|nr:response regulator transcription factor [Chloroflexota bacterium]